MSIHKVERVLHGCHKYIEQYIILFYSEEMAKTALEFYQMSGFPGVIGVVDGTHVRIQRPSEEEERAYINRHHHHSINVQAISLTCNCMNKRCTSKIYMSEIT